ncbi:MAG: hypothetical protein ACNA8W_08415, partial [Bradymonadaceae bacterium]
ETIFEALLEQSDELWEHVFVPPVDYASLVHVDLERAEEFVDVQIGKSLPTWHLFDVTDSSETPDGGLGSIFSFEEIQLGQGRTVDGPIAGEDDVIVQHWGNVVSLRFLDTELIFELTIPRIFLLDDREKPGTKKYVVASEIGVDHRLNTLLQIGLHLKSQLLRSREYPYPLKVGNFWRYRRYNAATGTPESFDPLDAPFGEGAEGLDGNEVILEVDAVERYGAYRLVRLNRRYNDQNLSRFEEHWLLTARRIYICSRACVTRARNQDLGWLLEYATHQVPIYRFPPSQGAAWGAGGRTTDSGIFAIDEERHDVETSAGNFPATLAVQGRGPLGDFDPHYRTQQTRFFSPGKGVVRRVLYSQDQTGKSMEIVEEIVEYRIIP